MKKFEMLFFIAIILGFSCCSNSVEKIEESVQIKVLLEQPGSRTIFPEYSFDSLENIKIYAKEATADENTDNSTDDFADENKCKEWKDYLSFISDDGIIKINNVQISSKYKFKLTAQSIGNEMSGITVADISKSEPTNISFVLTISDSDNENQDAKGNVKLTIDVATKGILKFTKAKATLQGYDPVDLVENDFGDFAFSQDVKVGNYLLKVEFYDDEKIVYTYPTFVIVKAGAVSAATLDYDFFNSSVGTISSSGNSSGGGNTTGTGGETGSGGNASTGGEAGSGGTGTGGGIGSGDGNASGGDSSGSGTGGSGGSSGGSIVLTPATVLQDANLAIHFMMLGNKKNGDSIYIKAGNTDILIDAGSVANSYKTLISYIDQYCTDKTLEYVIATHADADHIYSFPGIFDYYTCKTIIQFAETTKKNKPTQIYTTYCEKRDAEVKDEGAVWYTALQCTNQTDGAKKIYDLTGDGSITMEVLYQEYYEKATSNENDHSVCLLFTQGENHYYLLGDLEKAGEASLIANNPNLPHATLYKGGHHGSYTAASELLMSVLQPQYVCICCSAGSTEYTKNIANTFPAQDFIDRVALWTEHIYCTQHGASNGYEPNKDEEMVSSGGYAPLNGNIIFSSNGHDVALSFSESNLKLKDTEWFINWRTMPDAWANGTSKYK